MNFKISYIKGRRSLYKIAILGFLWTFFILFFFQPFGEITHGYTSRGMMMVLSYSVMAASAILLSEIYVLKIFRIIAPKGNKYMPLLWYFIELFILVIFIFICKSLWVNFEGVDLYGFLIVLYRVLIIAMLPLLLLVAFIYYSPGTNQTEKKVTLKSNEVNPEYLSIFLKELLYLESEENYTTIFYLGNRRINKKLLRGSLSFFEKQLVTLPFKRAHRSYILNLGSVEKLNANSQGGTIHLRGVAFQLKLSRKYQSEFLKAWKEHENN